MALGYPDVPGFFPALAAEKAMISSRLTATKGSVASAPFEIFAKSELLLITARVRGGFSGGPILNEAGDYIGLISRDPATQFGDELDAAIHKYDTLGYGTAIPSTLIKEFLEDSRIWRGEVSIPIDMTHTSFMNFAE